MEHGWPGMSLATFGFPGLGIGATRDGGAPIGVQLIGRPFEEETVLAAAEMIEARNGITTPIDPSYESTKNSTTQHASDTGGVRGRGRQKGVHHVS
jgi:hypothetical protein